MLFFAAVLYSAFAWSEITHPGSVLWKKSLPSPSPCCLCKKNGGGGKVVSERKRHSSARNFGLYYRRKVRDRKELGSCHWKALVKPLLLIPVVKGDSILHYASLKCKCYCKMRGVVFSLPIWGAGMAVLGVRAGRGLGIEVWLQTTFTIYTCQETRWKD